MSHQSNLNRRRQPTKSSAYLLNAFKNDLNTNNQHMNLTRMRFDRLIRIRCHSGESIAVVVVIFNRLNDGKRDGRVFGYTDVPVNLVEAVPELQ